MKAALQNFRRALTFVVLFSSSAAAQLVNIRTAPVNVSEQFYTFPSRYLGMGGGIALIDPEADPFANPATAARMQGAFVSSTPTFYKLPDHPGFGRTLPITVLANAESETPFGGISLAAQEVESAQNGVVPISGIRRPSRFANNYFAFGLLGQKLPKQRAAIAMSVSYSDLNHLHMVDLLYPDAASIEQGGSITDIRLGLLKELPHDGSLEAVLVRNHVAMEHKVTYATWSWVQTPQGWNRQSLSQRQEYNSDETTTWGAHTAYRFGVPESGWHLGFFGTANVKTHPHIPNYTFSHIPRDPGNSRAYALGMGGVTQDSLNILSLDLTYMPMWTSTWQEAGTPTKTKSGAILPIGAPTIENEFVFSNIDFHAGWAHRFTNTWIQLGLDVLDVNYALDQYDDINEVAHQIDDHWTETTLTWGLAFELPHIRLRYFGHARNTDLFRFGSEQSAPIVNIPEAPGPDIVSAPLGGQALLRMEPNAAVLHQFSISIPLGRKH